MREGEAERYFREFILPACRKIGDTGELIAVLQGQVEAWELVRDREPDAPRKLAYLQMTLLLIEARTRNSVEALQRAIDAAVEACEIDKLRAEGVL